MLVDLEDYAILKKGSMITKKRTLEGDIPVIAGGKKPAYYHNRYNRAKNCITVSSSGAHAGYVHYHAEPIFASDCITIESTSRRLSQKFLYHLLKSRQNEIYAMQSGGAQPHVYVRDFKGFRIALPPIETQKKVVQTLDNYGVKERDLRIELQKEIDFRKDQFDFYRDLILEINTKERRNNLGGGVSQFKLGDLCVIKSGDQINMKQILDQPGKFPVINSGKEPLGYIDRWNTANDPIGVTSHGAGVGSITWCDGRYFRGSLNLSCRIKEVSAIIYRYLFFVLRSSHYQIKELSLTGSIPYLTKTKLEALEIKVPSIQVQRKIVLILDELTACYEGLMSELEVERNARIDQYEYFRNKLLTF